MATLLPRYQQCNSMSGNLNLLMLQQRCWESHGRRLTYSSQIDLIKLQQRQWERHGDRRPAPLNSPCIKVQALQH